MGATARRIVQRSTGSCERPPSDWATKLSRFLSGASTAETESHAGLELLECTITSTMGVVTSTWSLMLILRDLIGKILRTNVDFARWTCQARRKRWRNSRRNYVGP